MASKRPGFPYPFGSPESLRLLEAIQPPAPRKGVRSYERPALTRHGAMAVAPGQSKIAKNMLLRGSPELLSNLKRNLGKLGTHPFRRPYHERGLDYKRTSALTPPEETQPKGKVSYTPRRAGQPLTSKFTIREPIWNPGDVEPTHRASPQKETVDFAEDRGEQYGRVLDELKQTISQETLDRLARSRQQESNEIARQNEAILNADTTDPYASTPDDLIRDEIEEQPEEKPTTKSETSKEIGERVKTKIKNRYLKNIVDSGVDEETGEQPIPTRLQNVQNAMKVAEFVKGNPNIMLHHMAESNLAKKPGKLQKSNLVLGTGIRQTAPLETGSSDFESDELDYTGEVPRPSRPSLGSPEELRLQEEREATDLTAGSLANKDTLPSGLLKKNLETPRTPIATYNVSGTPGYKRVAYEKATAGAVKPSELDKRIKAMETRFKIKKFASGKKPAFSQDKLDAQVVARLKALAGRGRSDVMKTYMLGEKGSPEGRRYSALETIKGTPSSLRSKEKIVEANLPTRSKRGANFTGRKQTNKDKSKS